MNKEITVIITKDEDWFIGQVKEYPGIISQGKTESELMDNMQDAWELMYPDIEIECFNLEFNCEREEW